MLEVALASAVVSSASSSSCDDNRDSSSFSLYASTNSDNDKASFEFSCDTREGQSVQAERSWAIRFPVPERSPAGSTELLLEATIDQCIES